MNMIPNLLILLMSFFLSSQNRKENNSGSEKAMAFVHSLTEKQKSSAQFSFEELNRYEWHYFPSSMVPRDGIGVNEMDTDQKQKLYTLMQAFLSHDGYERTTNIMSFEYLLKELERANSSRIPENYFIAIYGNPGKDEPWGWKFSGHHLALNFTIVNGVLAFAPFFFGVYPAEVKDGPKKGMRIIKEEEDLGFELVNSFSTVQKQKAIIQLRTFGDIVTTNDVKVDPLKPAGILAIDLTHEQKTVVNKLIAAYLLSMPTEIANTRMKKIALEDMNSISFGWAGATEPGKSHYYRIQGKSFLIEFDNTQNNGNHIHSVWRDFNGDYGRDLLKEHYQNSPHHH